MKTNLNFGIVLLVFFSCSVLRRDVKSDRMRAESATELKFWNQLDQKTFSLRTDSSLNETIVQLVPNGRFKFSPITGFEGEASSLHIIDKTKQISQERKKEHLQYETKLDAKSEDAVKQTSKITTADRISFIWVGIGLLLLFVASLVYRYWRSRLR